MPFNDSSGNLASRQRFHRFWRAELITLKSTRDMHSISEREEGGKLDEQLVSPLLVPSGCHATVRESVLPLCMLADRARPVEVEFVRRLQDQGGRHSSCGEPCMRRLTFNHWPAPIPT